MDLAFNQIANHALSTHYESAAAAAFACSSFEKPGCIRSSRLHNMPYTTVHRKALSHSRWACTTWNPMARFTPACSWSGPGSDGVKPLKIKLFWEAKCPCYMVGCTQTQLCMKYLYSVCRCAYGTRISEHSRCYRQDIKSTRQLNQNKY